MAHLPTPEGHFSKTEFDQISVKQVDGIILSKGNRISNTASGVIDLNGANIKTGSVTLLNNGTISNTEINEISIGTSKLIADSIELKSGNTIVNDTAGTIDMIASELKVKSVVLEHGDEISNGTSGKIDMNLSDLLVKSVEFTSGDKILNNSLGTINMGAVNLITDSIELENGGTIANTVQGTIEIGAASLKTGSVEISEDGTYKIGQNSINSPGILTNVAYQNQQNTFHGNQNFDHISIMPDGITSPIPQLSMKRDILCGVASLANGSVIVNTGAVTSNSLIFLTRIDIDPGTPVFSGHLYISNIDSGISFTIQSTVETDADTIQWMIIEQAS
ncbi:MAG: hypothetical protein EHM58_00525 [Ignavibacteriae bacterium]|nr:MAG: hypothetical protein EHM58_00525 [Ignavibacteriota bacterium]